MSEQAPTYTTEEGTVGYVIMDTTLRREGHDPVITGIKYATMAEAVAVIEQRRGSSSGHGWGLRVFEVTGIDREAELDMAEDLAQRHGHALISDEAVRELGPTLAAAEEEVAANE